MAPACPGKSPVAPALGHVVYVCSVAAGQNLTFFRFKSPLGHHDTGCIPLHLIAPAGSQDPGGDVHPGAAHPGAQRGPLTHPRASCAREDGSSKTRSMAGRDSEFAAQPVPGARFGWAESGEPSAARREYRSARLAVREPCLTRRPDDIRGCGDVRCRPSGRRTRRCRGTCPSIESRDAYDAPTQRALRRPSRYVGFIVNRP